MKSYGVAIQMKLLQQYFHMVLNTVLSKYVLSFGSMDKIKVYWTEIKPKGEIMQSIPQSLPPAPFQFLLPF